MKWLIAFRETSLTVACITAIIAQAMSQLTINLSVGGVFNGNLLYANLGVASGVLTILSLPLILLLDMAHERSYVASVLFELVWMVGMAVLWIVTGVQTMGVTSSTFKDCGNQASATLSGICSDAQTLVVFSLLSAGILLLYSAALGIAAATSAAGGKPIWTKFPVPKH